MARKNRTTPDTWRWGIYLVIGVLFMAVVVFFSGWRALRTTEARFCQILDFVKSQSTSFEKYNDTVVAKTLRRTAVSVHQLAQDPALDLSDPQCLNRQAELLWLTGISVLSPDGTLLCESTTNGIGYARFGEQLKNDMVLDVFSYPQKTYLKRVLLEDGSAVDVAAHRAEGKEVILLAYRYTPAEFIEGTALSIQSVLDGYSVETSGTLFIVQNNQVIASNRPELIGQDAADSPLVREIRKAGAAKTLTHTHDWNGSGCYFGMYCHGRSFDLYAYTDEKSVFRESFPLILMALAGYILLVMVLWVLRRRSVQEMEQQKKEQEKKYQAQLEEQNRKLEIALQHEGAANRAKREFLFNMSHDIRTPMNAIIGFTSLAATHIDNKEQVLDYLKKISTSSQHLLSLINDVLDMSRIESGKVIIITMVAGLFVPRSVALVGFLMFGNLIRECGVLDSLSETAQKVLANLITLLLGLTVASKMQAEYFLNRQTLMILALGLVAFVFDTIGGVLVAKVYNLFAKQKINPMIGAAGISAFPMSARVVNKMGLQEDNQNFLLMHAVGVNVSGQIASVIAGGMILTLFA